MAVLTPTTVTRAGVNLAGVAADVAGDEWANTGAEFVVVHNGSAGAITVTKDVLATVDGAAAVDPTVSVPAGESHILGPFPPGWYNDANNRAKVTCSAVATVTIKVLKFSSAA